MLPPFGLQFSHGSTIRAKITVRYLIEAICSSRLHQLQESKQLSSLSLLDDATIDLFFIVFMFILECFKSLLDSRDFRGNKDKHKSDQIRYSDMWISFGTMMSLLSQEIERHH